MTPRCLRGERPVEAAGEERQAQVFVAVLGASNYTYAEATWTQGVADWIASHQQASGPAGRRRP